MKLIFCGDRHWKDELVIQRVMGVLKRELGIFTVIEGEAEGADKMSRRIAEDVYELPVKPVPADWNKLGKAAGPIRNQQMLTLHRADGVVAFHMDIENSKGTADMIRRARMSKYPIVPVWLCTEGPEALQQFILDLKKIQACSALLKKGEV